MPTAKTKSYPVDLDLDKIETEAEPSFVFQIGGQTFRCRNTDDLHWDTVEKWLIARSTGDSGAIAVQIDGFFAAVLFPEDYEKFAELKKDPGGPLTVARSTALLEGVNEKLFGIRAAVDPTPRPARSGRGSSRNGTGSKAAHAGRVTPKA